MQNETLKDLDKKNDRILWNVKTAFLKQVYTYVDGSLCFFDPMLRKYVRKRQQYKISIISDASFDDISKANVENTDVVSAKTYAAFVVS